MTLFILDTDHLSLYQRAAEPLLSKLLSHPPDELAITVITVEEQLRGRFAQIRKAANFRVRDVGDDEAFGCRVNKVMRSKFIPHT